MRNLINIVRSTNQKILVLSYLKIKKTPMSSKFVVKQWVSLKSTKNCTKNEKSQKTFLPFFFYDVRRCNLFIVSKTYLDDLINLRDSPTTFQTSPRRYLFVSFGQKFTLSYQRALTKSFLGYYIRPIKKINITDRK